MQRRFARTHAAGVEGAARRTVLQGVFAILTAVPLAGLRTRHAAAAEQAVIIPAPAGRSASRWFAATIAAAGTTRTASCS